MSNAKEKAIELQLKMKNCLFSDGFKDAKECALIAVDEILKAGPYKPTGSMKEFWQEVKQELNNL